MTLNDPLSSDERTLLAAYYAGACDPGDQRRAEALLAQHPRAQLFARFFARTIAEDTVEVDADETRRALAVWKERHSIPVAALSSQRLPQPTAPHSASRLQGWSRRATWAAGTAILVAVIGSFALHLERGAGRVSARQVYRTVAGQQATIRLADGSTITLAPATSATVLPASIDVAGEAYFSIAPHAARPLVVRTQNAIVQVLGTTFMVRQYAGERKTRVVVEDGKVTVQNRGRTNGRAVPAILASQMLAQVTDSGVTVSTGIATRAYTSWRQGMLVFDSSPLRDVVVELGRAYGADIHVADSALAAKTVIAEVEVPQQSLARVLDNITAILNAHYVRDGSHYVLSPGRRTSPALNDQQQQRHFPQLETQYGR